MRASGSLPMLLHITTYLQGGAGHAVATLATARHLSAPPVAVVATRSAVPGFEHYPEFLGRLRTAGVPLLLVDSTFRRDRAANRAVVETVSATLDLDSLALVHAHAGTPARIGLALARLAPGRVPVVQTMHGWGGNKTPAQAAEDLATLQAVDRVVVTSNASAREMTRRGVPRERIVTIPCGLSSELPATPGHPLLRECQARRAAGAAVLLCIGTLNANKSQRRLVEAMPAILRSRPALCVFVGEGPDGPELERLGSALGVRDHLRFAGYQPMAAGWLSMADLLVQPSRSEGQGLAVLEAFRAGVPVVASDIAPHRELIDDQVSGWMYDPAAPSALGAAVVAALEAPGEVRLRLAAAAREVFFSRYTTEAMTSAHERLYDDLLRCR